MSATAAADPSAKGMASFSVYGGGLIIGLTLVSFPASSAVLKAAHGFSDQQYGAIYLPQLVAALAGALGGGALVGRLGLKRLYLTALVCFAAAHGLLIASAFAGPGPALAMIMAATGLFGFGFGFGGGPLNAYAVLLYPRASNAALTALHMCAGAGLTIGPYYFAALAARGHWLWGPASLLAVALMLIGATLSARFPEGDDAPAETLSAGDAGPWASRLFWICAAVAVLYSIAEGVFSNWAIIYLQEEKALPGQTAALALTSFWAALTLGRLIASLLAARLAPINFLLVLPLLMVGGFLLLPHVEGAGQAIAAFAFAGLACSAFFPMLVAYAAGPFPRHVSWIASLLTAAMMVGVGIGSYVVGALKGAHPISELYLGSIAFPALVLGLMLLGRAWAPARLA